MMEERELAIRCARGDSAAQRELYQQYGSRILALCRRYAADPADAEAAKHPARQNLRPIPLTVGNEKWEFQYSPYGYYNEHCIVFNTDYFPQIFFFLIGNVSRNLPNVFNHIWSIFICLLFNIFLRNIRKITIN